MKSFRIVAAFAAACLPAALCLSGPVHAADFLLDPDRGSRNGAGTEDDPLSSLADVLGSDSLGQVFAPGDRLVLRAGFHGDLEVRGGDFDPPILIEAETGEAAQLGRISIRSTKGLIVRGLSISPSHAPSYERTTIVDIGAGSSSVVVEDCEIFSEEDASGWGVSDWVDGASNGVDIAGEEVTLRGNVIRNVRFGISASGERHLVEGNTIDGFSADALRGLGNHQVFQYNLVQNAYVGDDEDDNHDDGFQSWADGPDGVGSGEIVGVVLRGNMILNYRDEDQPLRSTLQGIGCFDGTYTDWVVENNVVITDHWHGITLLGAKDCRVVNNTVMDVNGDRPGPPWISVEAHKDGTPPEGCIVSNNLATDYALAGSVSEDHNFRIDDPSELFVDPGAFDFRLREDAEVIDQGSSADAAPLDADRIERPQGQGVDPGAFEWHEPGVEPTEPGPALGADPGKPSGKNGSQGPEADAGADDSGCSCRLAPRSSSHAPFWLAALALGWLSRRAVRRRSGVTRPSRVR